MAINITEIIEDLREYPEIDSCIVQSKSMKDSLQCYEYLYNQKSKIPKRLYGFYLRKLLLMNTANVSDELKLKMLEGVNPEDIMYQDELDEIEKNFEDKITVYRGTSKKEDIPGIFWTKYRHIAEEIYYRGRLYKALISKKSILLYSTHESAEGEIIVHVTSNYEIV